MSPRLTTFILIVSIVALVLSAFNTYTIFQLDKKTGKSITELKAVADRIDPLVPHFETLGKVLPRLNQLLLAIPPATESK